MVNPNTQSLGPCWVYEGTTGTASLVAGDGTFLFGEPVDANKPAVNAPTLQYIADVARNYAARYPTNQSPKWGGKMEWKYKYIPTNAQHAYRLLGSAASAAVNGISAKDTGQKKALTIHLESKGGTNPRRWNAVGALSTGLRVVMEENALYTVEEEFNYWSLENEDEATCPALTASPTYPDTQSYPYQGISTVTLAGVAQANVYRVELTLSQTINTTPNGTNKGQKVYVGELQPPSVGIYGTWLTTEIGDELYAGTHTSELVVKCCQTNAASNYIQWTLNNVLWLTEANPIPLGGTEGTVTSIAFGQAESASVTFVWGGTASNFSTHFPT